MTKSIFKNFEIKFFMCNKLGLKYFVSKFSLFLEFNFVIFNRNFIISFYHINKI